MLLEVYQRTEDDCVDIGVGGVQRGHKRGDMLGKDTRSTFSNAAATGRCVEEGIEEVRCFPPFLSIWGRQVLGPLIHIGNDLRGPRAGTEQEIGNPLVAAG